MALSVGLGVATSGYSWVMKYAFETLGKGQFEALLLVVCGIISMTTLRAAFIYAYAVYSASIVGRISTDMQKLAFAHLINADYARSTRESTGHLLTRVTGEVSAIAGAAGMALTAIRTAITMASALATMIYFDWMLSLIVIFVYPFTALPVIGISRRLRKVAKRTQVESSDLASGLIENFGAARLVKTFRLEGYAIEHIGGMFEKILQLRLKANRAKSRIGPMLEAFAGLAIAGIIALASWRVTSGISSNGDFMAFITALLLGAQSVRASGNMSAIVNEGVVAAERFYELIDEQPNVVDRPGAVMLRVGAGALAFDRVAFAYASNSEVPAVRDFTLTIPGGKTAALVGRSGAGKSTVINLVPRLYDVDAGTITIDGQELRDVTLASLRDAIAIVSQDVTLFDDSIRANIGLGKLGASDEAIIAAAKAAAAHDFIMKQPAGYDTVIGDGGQRLSGGQRQRLALARAILKDAPILLLDEATSALDTESELLVQEALARFTKNRTTLVIAHRLSTVQRADIICVMEDGRVAETGTHIELLARNGAYARLSRLQFLAPVETEPVTSVAAQ